MAINGLRDTSGFTSSQRPTNFREYMMLLEPNGEAPMTALSSMMKSRTVDDPVYNWFEETLDRRRVTLTAAITTSTTTLAVAASADGAAGAFGLKAGDLLVSLKTMEVFRVTTDPAIDTAVTVSRGFEDTTPTAIDPAVAGTDPYLYVVGSAYEQGSLAPTGVAWDGYLRTNYCQIFRHTTEITGTAAQTYTRDTPKGAFVAQRQKLARDMARQVEMGMWFGRKKAATHNGKPLYTMDGLFAQLPTENVVTADTSTGTDMLALEEYLYNAFQYGSSQKMAFCGNRAALTLNQILRKNSTWEIYGNEKEYGMNVSKLICPFGELTFKTHPLFTYMNGGTVGGTKFYGAESYFAILDPTNLKYVSLRNRDIMVQKNLQLPGADGLKEGYLGEVSIEVGLPKTMYLIKNLALAKKDA